MGKRSKEHRKKVAKRNEKIKNNTKSFEKARNEYMEFLKQKAEKEAAEKNQQNIPGVNGPSIFNGPQI